MEKLSSLSFKKEIESIKFGILSDDDILRMSVCEINITKLHGDGSVYDKRMGGTLDNKNCITCKKRSIDCAGHFGHIKLNEPIINPCFLKNTVSFLRCFCIKCSKLLLTNSQLEMKNILCLKGEKRFKTILDYSEKNNTCAHCILPQPKISYNSDGQILMVYKNKHVGIVRDELKLSNEGVCEKDKIIIKLEVSEVEKIFNMISDKDIETLGIDPSLSHPKHFIMNVFPVPPPCVRPFLETDNDTICDDDLTSQLLEIIKCNKQLGKDLPDTKKQKYLQTIQFRVSSYFNNSSGKSKHPTTGRPMKGIKERLSGKKGLIRENIMGKRVEQSARTVIGPDPTLRVGQVAVPKYIAQNTTVPENVTQFNIKKLEKLVNDGKTTEIVRIGPDGETRVITSKYIIRKRGTLLNYDDVILRKGVKMVVTDISQELQEGDRLFRNDREIDVVYPEKRYVKLKIGDVVRRQLQNGDIVLLNRQPTLHKGSMLAMEVVLNAPYKTFRMNLAVTKTYNADFDGDEMNIHVPQSIESQTELRLLSATKHNIVSSQGSKTNICIVQDSLLGIFKMTKGFLPIKKERFFNICMSTEYKGKIVWSPRDMKRISNVYKRFGIKQSLYNGKSLFSLILPEDFCYTHQNNATTDEPEVKIYNGVLYSGVINKQNVGSSTHSIIHLLFKEYGKETACLFIDNIQFITNNFLLEEGFSIGLQDCMNTNPNNEQNVKNSTEKCYIEAKGVEETTYDPIIREVRVTGALSKAKDIGMKIAKDSMNPNNNLLSTVYSGSKGDFFNIAQLTGLLGQQNIMGQRVKYTLNHGTRSLPHYPFEGMSKKMEYESKGFIRHSFIHGLNPQEFYFHAMSGREGICDTSMNTAVSGYIQRRIVKLCEDIKVHYDGTVRDTNNNIYQYVYGQNHMDPSMMVQYSNKKGKTFCDISRLADQLNLQFESRLEQN